MEIDLSEKVIVVTGASGGRGQTLIKAIAKEGAFVVINYKNSYLEAQYLKDKVIEYGSKCLVVQGDVSNISDVINLYKLTIEKFGKVDILINNAGIIDDAKISEMSYEKWIDVIDTNLTGTFNCCKIFSESMIHQKKGKIINIASIKGQNGSAEQVNYSASKSGVIGLTKALAKELGEYNISVNAICPGYIRTNLNKDNYTKYLKAIDESCLGIEKCEQDLISFILLFSSDKISSVSGRIFNLDSRIK